MPSTKISLLMLVMGLSGLGVLQKTYFFNFRADQRHREMWLHFGPGRCLWQEPTERIPDYTSYETIVVAGFPSGDKRIVFAQMEGMTGLKTIDSWDVKMLGKANEPFIKGNYPHAEGTWGWGTSADKVVLAVRNIRATMVEYHAIKFDLGYPRNYRETQLRTDMLFSNFDNPDAQRDFLEWRDMKVIGEIKRYGWFIDYWMEGGLLRDISSNQPTTLAHWEMLRNPLEFSTEQSLAQFQADREAGIVDTYDQLCVNGTLSNGCEPVEVICSDSILDPVMARPQIQKIGNLLQSLDGVQDYLIAEDAWDCIWNELVVNRKGSMMDREKYNLEDYVFPRHILEAMLDELNRLITKYSQIPWLGQSNAGSLVMILSMHRTGIQNELASMP